MRYHHVQQAKGKSSHTLAFMQTQQYNFVSLPRACENHVCVCVRLLKVGITSGKVLCLRLFHMLKYVDE